MRKLVIRIIGQVLSIGIFVSLFLFSLFITYGYRYDFSENTVIQTSVIDICTLPGNANLYLDGSIYGDDSCQKIFGIGLGGHTIQVKKDGYYEWSKNLYLDDTNASLYSQVLLIPRPEFYTTTTLEEGVDKIWISPNQSRLAVYDKVFGIIKIFSASDTTPAILEVPAKAEDINWIDDNDLVIDTNEGRFEVNINKGEWKETTQVVFHTRPAETNLSAKGNEIWAENNGVERFITRYSEPVVSVQYFYNQSNLLISTEREVRICDFEGENCQVVAIKDAGSPIAHPDRSKKIIFVQDGVLKQLTLNGPSENKTGLIGI
jgi:hypothetical protein